MRCYAAVSMRASGQAEGVQIRHLQQEIEARIGHDTAARLRGRCMRPAGHDPANPAGAEVTMAPSQGAGLTPADPSAEHARRPPPRAHPLHSPIPARSPAAAPATPRLSNTQLAALPPFTRCRFSTDGLPVSWVDDEELRRGTLSEEVVTRDLLRTDEGTVAIGYTVEEAVLLLQCSHTPLQRAGVTLLLAPFAA